MVSTPIGAPNSPEKIIHYSPKFTANTNVERETITISSQSTINQAPNNYPMLYTTPQLDATPISLYSEFIGNPYNLPNNFYGSHSPQPVLLYQTQNQNSNPNPNQPSDACSENAVVIETTTDNTENTDNDNSTIENSLQPEQRTESFYDNQQTANIFQSSNYFYTDPNQTNNIPPGSEILFGADKSASNANVLFFDAGVVQNNDIPSLLTPPNSKT